MVSLKECGAQQPSSNETRWTTDRRDIHAHTDTLLWRRTKERTGRRSTLNWFLYTSIRWMDGYNQYPIISDGWKDVCVRILLLPCNCCLWLLSYVGVWYFIEDTAAVIHLRPLQQSVQDKMKTRRRNTRLFSFKYLEGIIPLLVVICSEGNYQVIFPLSLIISYTSDYLKIILTTHHFSEPHSPTSNLPLITTHPQVIRLP